MKLRRIIYYPILRTEFITKYIFFKIFYSFYKKLFKKYFLNPNLIPVYIISFNRLKYLKQSIEWLESNGHTNIIIIDNNSTFKPLLEFYDHTPHKVIKINKNKGHLVFHKDIRFFFIRNFTFYVLTDPDLLPVKECPADYMNHFVNTIKSNQMFTKVGFSLKIDDLPDTYPLKNLVIEWESKFYKNPIIYKNLTLYKNSIEFHFLPM
jgi:hypothetical protein